MISEQENKSGRIDAKSMFQGMSIEDEVNRDTFRVRSCFDRTSAQFLRTKKSAKCTMILEGLLVEHLMFKVPCSVEI